MTAPVFVVGCPRSGTGLLRDLLRSHPNLAFTGESHYIPLYYRAYGDPRSDREAVALARRILRVRWVEAWGVGRDPRSFAHHRSFATLVDDLNTTYAASAGRPRWGDKTPQYVAAMPTLRELFPAARFVHIIRDGRDVAQSLLRRPFGPANPFTAGRYWRTMVQAGRRDGATLGEAYTEVRYEELLAEPERVLRAVIEFVGEPWSDAVLLPVTGRPVDPARAASWRSGMPPADRALVESAAGDLLAALGYEAAGAAGAPEPTDPPAAWRRAVIRADHVARLVRNRLDTREHPAYWRTERDFRLARLRAAVRGRFG
ncbi:MAG TPA: sulfotransferase [Solirubrobacteraceae bacterium]